jgi:hypothetical protein
VRLGLVDCTDTTKHLDIFIVHDSLTSRASGAPLLRLLGP